MTKYKLVVEVPATQANAYNPDRPISDLVRNQVMHLSLAERHLELRDRTGKDIYAIQTERQASEYIAHVTKKIHEKQKTGKRKSVKKAG
jgi:hypothetical protein